MQAHRHLAGIGYSLAIYPSITGVAASENALKVFKTEGRSNSPKLPLFNFREFQSLIAFDEVWAFERASES